MDGLLRLHWVFAACVSVRYTHFLVRANTHKLPLHSWGVVPIVREAQNEPTLEFPRELDVPWKVLQRRFGITSPGGNLTSNVYANCDFTSDAHTDVAVSFPSLVVTKSRVLRHEIACSHGPNCSPTGGRKFLRLRLMRMT